VGVEVEPSMRDKRTLIQKISGLMRQAKVPMYLHHFGPKEYTSLQHCKAWLLKEKLKCSWQTSIDDFATYFLDEIPDRSMLIKFVYRLLIWLKNKLVFLSAGLEPAEYGAIDSTGLSRIGASNYYLKRIDRDEPMKRSSRLSMYTSKRRILSFRLRSKWCGDTLDVKYLVDHSPVIAETICLDKGYDSNDVHQEFRDSGVCSIIAVRKGCKRGQYRKEMRDYFDCQQYLERNFSEYNNSSIKRCFQNYIRSIKFVAQHSEVSVRIILHNIKQLFTELFHRSVTILMFRVFYSP
jgi:hypothetical protein